MLGGMAVFHLAASGPRDPADVWERYARPELWSTWSPQISRVEVDVERIEEGTTGRVVGPLGISVDFEVDVWHEEARRWTWTVRPRLPGPGWRRGVPSPQLRLDHGVVRSRDGTLTWLRVSGPMLLVVPYLPPARLALHRLVH